MVLLVAGLILTYTFAPDYYVDRYHAVQQGHLIGREKFAGYCSSGFVQAIRTRF